MDQGHRETETLIKALEQKVNREYSQATRELTAKLEDYFRRFEVKDEKWRIMVQNGERTVEEYQKWRFGQMMVGERWENMRDSIAEDLHNQNLISRGMLTGRMTDAYALNHNWSTYDIEKAGRVNTGYTLYNRNAVERLLRDDPDLLKPPGVQMQKTFADWDAYINKDLGNIEDQITDIRKAYPTNMPPAVQSQLNRLEQEKRSFDKLMADGKDIRWQKGQIQSVTLQSILQGESIPNMAKRIANTMGEMNRKASIRYARTAMTSAQNAGRKDAYQRAKGLGINLQQEWIATLDFRTRHAHRQLDGQIRDIDEPFQVDGYGIEYPGDPAAPGYLVYNCRCTTVAKVEGWDSMSGQLRSDEDIEGMSYEEWKEGHSQPQDILSQEETSEAMRQRTIRDLYGGSGATTTQTVGIESLRDVANQATDKYDFWMSLDEDQQAVFKASGMSLDDAFASLKTAQVSEWKAPAPGGAKSFAISHEFNDKTEFNAIPARSAGWMADATGRGTINVREDGLGENWDFIISHEAGHQLSNMSPELQQTIMLNPGNVLGRYNTRQMFFDGVYGEYNPEEAFATSVSNFIRHPQSMKEKYPDTYDAINELFKASPSARTYVESVMEDYRRRFLK